MFQLPIILFPVVVRLWPLIWRWPIMLPSGQESEKLRYLPHSAFRWCDFCVFCFFFLVEKTEEPPRYLEMSFIVLQTLGGYRYQEKWKVGWIVKSFCVLQENRLLAGSWEKPKHLELERPNGFYKSKTSKFEAKAYLGYFAGFNSPRVKTVEIEKNFLEDCLVWNSK